jgi:hypothetical protein
MVTFAQPCAVITSGMTDEHTLTLRQADQARTDFALLESNLEFLAGQLAHTRATLRQLIIDLDHVDAAIRIFDPNYDVEGIRQKLPTAAHRALRGDLTRATRSEARPIRFVGDRRLGRSLASSRPNLILDRLGFEHIKDQAGADRRQLFPIKSEWNQAVIYHLHRIKRQSNRELLGVEIAHVGHSRGNGIAMGFHCLI